MWTQILYAVLGRLFDHQNHRRRNGTGNITPFRIQNCIQKVAGILILHLSCGAGLVYQLALVLLIHIYTTSSYMLPNHLILFLESFNLISCQDYIHISFLVKSYKWQLKSLKYCCLMRVYTNIHVIISVPESTGGMEQERMDYNRLMHSRSNFY